MLYHFRLPLSSLAQSPFHDTNRRKLSDMSDSLQEQQRFSAVDSAFVTAYAKRQESWPTVATRDTSLRRRVSRSIKSIGQWWEAQPFDIVYLYRSMWKRISYGVNGFGNMVAQLLNIPNTTITTLRYVGTLSLATRNTQSLRMSASNYTFVQKRSLHTNSRVDGSRSEASATKARNISRNKHREEVPVFILLLHNVLQLQSRYLCNG